jgi:hypothetical protein
MSAEFQLGVPRLPADILKERNEILRSVILFSYYCLTGFKTLYSIEGKIFSTRILSSSSFSNPEDGDSVCLRNSRAIYQNKWYHNPGHIANIHPTPTPKSLYLSSVLVLQILVFESCQRRRLFGSK